MTEVDGADTPAGLPRRGIFQGAGGLAALAALIVPGSAVEAAAEGDDAALLALADEGERAWLSWQPLMARLGNHLENDPAEEAELARLQDIGLDIADRAGRIRATTIDGYCAKLRLAVLHGGGDTANWCGTENYIVGSLVMDLLGAAEIKRIEAVHRGGKEEAALSIYDLAVAGAVA